MMTIEKILETRNTDAALYLLERMLGLGPELLGERQARLAVLQAKVSKEKKLSGNDESFIALTFREVIG